jgi:hypothetical protein
VIIGGLLSSTLLARIVTPVLYAMAAAREDARATLAGAEPRGHVRTPIPAVGTA